MTLTPSTRDSLLLNIRDAENRDAWAEFVEIYEPAIYRSIRLAGLQDADASDLTQEILLKVNQHVHTWQAGKEHGSFRGWLRVVTRNLIVSWFREKKRHPGSHGSWSLNITSEHACATADETADFDKEEARSAFRFAAKQVRNEVHDSTWQAFWKVAVEGISIEETAQLLGMNQGAVRVAKCRVQARLKKIIREMNHE